MKKVKKSLPIFIASVLAVNMAAVSVLNIGALAATEKFEFEDAAITGEVTVENDAAASGGSYLKMANSGTITKKFNIDTAGTYTISVYASGIGGAKQQDISVNGVSLGALSIPESDGFEKISLFSVKLNAGENTLSIAKSWGWSNFDYFTVESADSAIISASDTTCCDKKAIPEAQNLMNYMASVYGKNIISGQQEIYKYGHGGNFEQEFDYLQEKTGKLPAIRGFDYLNCVNILYGSEDGTTDRMIDWVKNKNGIITASWHITVPKSMAGYKVGDSVSYDNATYNPKLTDFVTSNVLVDGTVEREFYLESLKVLAAEIKKLQDQNIPLIFRPLHEAEGGGGETASWFWWGKDGSAVYKDIWKLTYKTLTEEYGLHNIIWEWNSYNFATSADWYPGDEYVDIIAYDKYNCSDWSTGSEIISHNDSAIASTFYGIMDKYNSKKMIAMAENDSFSTVENLVNDKAGWLYFCTWYDGEDSAPKFLSDPIYNTLEDTINMYQSDYCITLDELPKDLYTNGNITTKPTDTKPTGTTTTTATTTKSGGETEIKADIKKDTDGYRFTLSEPIGDTLYVKFDADKSVKFANGCVGISIDKTDMDYWVSYKWEIAGSDTVKIDLSNPFEVSFNNGEDKVTDKATIAEIAKLAQKQNTGLVQVWWTNDSAGEQIDNSNVVLTDAYIIKSVSSSDTTTTTTETTTSTTETTTSSTTATSTNTTTETTITTTTIIIGDVKYGDLNLDNSISMVDLIYLNKYLANAVTLNPTQLANADCYDNGQKIVDPKDATALMARLSERIDSLPVYVDEGILN